MDSRPKYSRNFLISSLHTQATSGRGAEGTVGDIYGVPLVIAGVSVSSNSADVLFAGLVACVEESLFVLTSENPGSLKGPRK